LAEIDAQASGQASKAASAERFAKSSCVLTGWTTIVVSTPAAVAASYSARLISDTSFSGLVIF
jgi:hypothetical protein